MGRKRWSRRLLRCFSISSLWLLTACSGATPTELFGPVGRSEGATEPVGGSFGEDDERGSEGASSGSRATGGSAEAGSSSSESGTSAGSEDDGADDGDDDAAPAPTCTKESEPNDEPGEATVFTSCVGGTVARDDVDHAVVVAPANAERVRIVHAESGGKVAYRVFVADIAVPSLEEDGMPAYVPFVAGARYRFEMRAAEKGGAGPRAYEVRVLFE